MGPASCAMRHAYVGLRWVMLGSVVFSRWAMLGYVG